KLLRQLDEVKHPADATAPTEPQFHLKDKPRGLLNVDYLGAIDETLLGGKSEVVQVHIKRGGGIGYRNNSDAAEPGEFASLLQHVRKRIGDLTDQIVAGRIDVLPYRMNDVTP